MPEAPAPITEADLRGAVQEMGASLAGSFRELAQVLAPATTVRMQPSDDVAFFTHYFELGPSKLVVPADPQRLRVTFIPHDTEEFRLTAQPGQDVTKTNAGHVFCPSAPIPFTLATTAAIYGAALASSDNEPCTVVVERHLRQ